MSEMDKKDSGQWYISHYDPNIFKALMDAKEKCFRLNQTSPLEMDRQREILESLFGYLGEGAMVLPPFECDYGYNIRIGAKSFLNHYVYLMDCAPITLGSHVLIGPYSGLYTAIHATAFEDRNIGLERTEPIRIGDNVWLGGNVTVLPGVTVGEGSVIGAKSLVNKDIPPGVIAAGNPCKVIREITDRDRLDESILREYL